MSLILRTVVVVTILALSTTATPPPGYIKQLNNDENPPKYQYKYKIEDQAGDGQGKAEKRDGEQASGQYYVNSRRSSTDVKYTVDEWGYHPLVKYDSSDEHSSASASFAIGEQAVKNLQQEDDPAASPASLNVGDRRKLIQIIQPYHRLQSSTGENIILNLNSSESSEINQSSTSFPTADFSIASQSNAASADLLNSNHVSNSPLQQIVEVASSSDKNIFLESGHQPRDQYPANFQLALNNDLTSTVPETDQLIVENVGNFGQRLQVQSQETSAYATSVATTASPISTSTEISTLSSSTRGGRYFYGRGRQKNNKPYLPDTIPGLGAYSSTAFPPVDNSVTTNSIESGVVSAQAEENKEISKSSIFKSYSSPNSLLVTTPNPLLINYASEGVLSSKQLERYEKQEYGFSKPIVVADVPKDIPFQYSTTFHCEDDISSNTPNPLNAFKDDTLSSHILNPIQAGVSLVNAGETHLIGNGRNIDDPLPAPVTEQIEETVQADQVISQINTNNISVPGSNYVGVSPAFGDQQDTAKSQQETQQFQNSQKDQTVEIQKSIEIYQSSPGQAPQYLEQPATIQLDQPNQTYLDQQQLQNYKDQIDQIQSYENQQQQTRTLQIQNYEDQRQPAHMYVNVSPHKYLSNNVQSNLNQLSNTNVQSDTYSKTYETNGNYSKDSVDEQPVYVVAPATYILEGSSVLKNNLLQEKIQQNFADTAVNDLKVTSYTEQVDNQSAQQPYSSYDSSTAYVSDTTQEHQHGIILPQAYHVEKIIEKKVPYPVEKIVEKKVPVPQPYPVPIQIPVPEPYPIHIEKVVERKIPIPVHIPIPHPYPVEKPIHIPIPVEKIVEKPVHIPITVEKIIEKKVPVPQPYPVEVTKYIEKPIPLEYTPYGIQYGISYQQIMKPQKNGLFSSPANNLASLYALQSSNNFLQSNKNNKNANDINVNNVNHSQSFQGYVYDKPAIPFIEGKENVEHNQLRSPAKLAYNSYSVPNYPVPNGLLHRRHTAVHRSSKPERDDYLGPAPPLPHVQRQYGFQSKTYAIYPATADRGPGSRKGRNQEPVRYQKGNFRQSKIEYGFKPPMVPSVQYDEETASKVES